MKTGFNWEKFKEGRQAMKGSIGSNEEEWKKWNYPEERFCSLRVVGIVCSGVFMGCVLAVLAAIMFVVLT